MNFSTNQVRQLYVALYTGNNVKDVVSYKNPGFLNLVPYTDNGIHIPQGHSSNTALDLENLSFLFKYRNALSELTHSDIITHSNIRLIKYTPAGCLRTPLCKMTITPSATNVPAAGDIVYLNFTFPAYISLTPEENMTKTVCFKYEGGTFKNELAAAINLAFKSNYNTTNTLVTATVSGNNVVVKATMPKWRRGLMEARPNVFEITNLTYEDMNTSGLSSLPLESNSRIKTWGTVTDSTNISTSGDYITDGYNLADLEYFCMGERGDVYRGINWPNNIETAYMVDPTAEYDVIDLHYYYQGEGINDDKSEKVITILVPKDTLTDDDSNSSYTHPLMLTVDTLVGLFTVEEVEEVEEGE